MSNSSNQRRSVLSEEEYSATLSSIVQRDYFPDLPSLQKQAAVLDRREVNDFKGAVAVRRAARRLQDHEDTLAEKERQEEEYANIRATKRPLHRESVTGFHARVTSEDNQEFEQNLQQEVNDRKRRIEAVYLNPQQTLKNDDKKKGNETPLLASDQFNPPWHRIEASKTAVTDNGFFFPPRHSTEPEAIPSLLLTNSSERDLMPPPAQVFPKQALVEYIPKQMLEKRIEPSRTRFPESTAVVPTGPITPTDDTDYSTEASTDLDSPGLSLDRERKARIKQQTRELETLVAMTPLLAPQASPLTTWGTVNSTPIVLTKAFSLPEESARDKAAKAAEEKLIQRRAKSTTSWNRTSSLTPAAQSLLKKSVPHTSSVRSANALSNALQKSYTPAPMSRRIRDVAGSETPISSTKSSKGGFATELKPTKNPTDGLLHLPK